MNQLSTVQWPHGSTFALPQACGHACPRIALVRRPKCREMSVSRSERPRSSGHHFGLRSPGVLADAPPRSSLRPRAVGGESNLVLQLRSDSSSSSTVEDDDEDPEEVVDPVVDPDDITTTENSAQDENGGWFERLEPLLPRKEDQNCDGDMCDMDFQGQGTVLGAALLIAGSTLGGGMLAVPAVAYGAGFTPAIACMVGVWLFCLCQGLLLVEVILAVAEWLQRRSASILSVARMTLGPTAGTALAVVYALLSNATLIAQIVRGGSLLQTSLPALPYLAGAALVAAVGGGTIYFTSSKGLDNANQALTAAMVASFVGLLVLGVQQAEWLRLFRADWPASLPAVPTILQVLGFCNIVPVVCTYLDLDKERIVKAVVIGSAIPLVMVSLWTALSFAMVPFVEGAAALDPVVVLLQGGGGVLTGDLFSVFAGAAVLTTVIGMLLTLHEFWEDALRSKATGSASDDGNGQLMMGAIEPKSTVPSSAIDEPASAASSEAPSDAPWKDHPGVQELAARVISLSPALVVAALVPAESFFRVLSISGAYFVPLLFGLAPPLMVWVTRGNRVPGVSTKWQGPTSTPILPGGSLLLSGLFSVTAVYVWLSFYSDISGLLFSA